MKRYWKYTHKEREGDTFIVERNYKIGKERFVWSIDGHTNPEDTEIQHLNVEYTNFTYKTMAEERNKWSHFYKIERILKKDLFLELI